MKNRVKVLLLSACLTAGMFGAVTSYGEEAASEAVQEMATEIEAIEDAAGDTASAEGVYAQYYDQMREMLPSTLEQLSAMTDDQLDSLIESDDASRLIAANWKSVKEELGAFVSCEDVEVVEEENTITISGLANYDGVNEKTKVNVSYVLDLKNQSYAMSWDIKYPMSTLIAQAGMNTLIGIMIVFLVLLFLSFLISQMHWIPEIVEGRKKKTQAAAPAPAAPAPAAVVEEEEELMDDGELIAVIAAAIAASEQTSTDGFVVRSIRKANRKNWQNA